MSALWTVLLAGLVIGSSDEYRFYVAPDGNDAWSGRSATADPARSQGPFRSLRRATDAVRAVRSKGFKGRVTVIIAPGVYVLTEPWRIAPGVSGTKDGPTVFRAAKPGKVFIRGGRVLTHWRVRDAGLWELRVPGRTEVQQLFVNGKRRTRARSPNDGYFRIAGSLVPWQNRTEARKRVDTRLGIRVRPEDLRHITPADLDTAEILLFHSWTASRHHIEQLDRDRGTIRFTAPCNWPVGYWDRQARWYLENCRAALDAPGEWYFDRQQGVLLYKPLPNEQPTSAEAVVPELSELLVLAGDARSERYVAHVGFEGLVFEYTDWRLGRNERCDGQAAAFLKTAAVHAYGARNCYWRDCVIRHVGTYGLWLDEGCQRNVVEGCALVDLGAGGVRIGQTGLPKAPSRRAEHNTVRDCLIRSTGRVYHAGVGVWIGRSSYNTIEHNHICDLFYTGISVGWSWGYAPSSANHNQIVENVIHNVGQGMLSDMGGIYTLGISPGTVIRGNVIYDVESYSYGGWGIYPDEGSSYLEITDNLVYRTKTGGFHQHYGKENRVVNNIFAFSRLQQLQLTRPEPHVSFYFERNIVVYDRGELMAGAWERARVVLDNNVYWNYSGPVRFPGNRSLAEWQALGHDEHSVVADPLFGNTRALDFAMRPGSPALKLGFRMFDWSDAGPRKKLPVPLHEEDAP